MDDRHAAQGDEALRKDFDRIARLTAHQEDIFERYETELLDLVPMDLAAILEVGCGTGAVTRKLAKKAIKVVAIDLAPEMIRVARERSAVDSNIEYLVDDFMHWSIPQEMFDCVLSIATLHHLPFYSAIQRMCTAVKPGGLLLILDLFESHLSWNLPLQIFALCASKLRKFKTRTGNRPGKKALKRAWAEHSRHDQLLPYPELQKMFARILPGCRISRHLLWRYSVEWYKPHRSPPQVFTPVIIDDPS